MRIGYSTSGIKVLFCGDNLEVLKTFPENDVDSVITDPPYGLKFMGKKWDYSVPSVELWREVLRVLKPGGHLLSFGGTRTYHRMVVNIEDAGFEIRDQMQWLYGSGFPKSFDISKAIDKAAGAEREILGFNGNQRPNRVGKAQETFGKQTIGGQITEPSTDLAKQWDGWGTALKPANEPIVLARKPLEKGLTVAENVTKWGCGAINIDECRVGADSTRRPLGRKMDVYGGRSEKMLSLDRIGGSDCGRWPANLILDEEAAEMLGEPSRFFYVAKASKAERGKDNNHPTVKPIKLMEYLIKLITPPGGTVLDPFMGSGSTGVAAKNLNFKFKGIELNKDYYAISVARIENNPVTIVV